MKNLRISFLKPALCLVILSAVFVSCKKDYSCECSGSSLTANDKRDLGKLNKKDAEEACDAFEINYQMRYPDVSCSLK